MAWVTVVLTTFDLRLIGALVCVGLLLLKMTRVPVKAYRTLLIATASVLSLKCVVYVFISATAGN